MSLKKITALNKPEKLMLLKSIAAGEVDRKTLTDETLVSINFRDAFLALMVAADNEGTEIICLGESSKAMEQLSKYLP